MALRYVGVGNELAQSWLQLREGMMLWPLRAAFHWQWA